MNRRSFFKWLGAGTAAVVVAPSVLVECDDPWCGSIAGEGIIPHDELHTFVDVPSLYLKEYNEYTNFSHFALQSSIDEIVGKAAEDLGKAAGERVNALCQTL